MMNKIYWRDNPSSAMEFTGPIGKAVRKFLAEEGIDGSYYNDWSATSAWVIVISAAGLTEEYLIRPEITWDMERI